ncbi:uncharacterized protein LOC119682684 [Teleopsis dalmanni]|uniref:uncharacterized protein LOC119682684 n=1 Tax=Teleopsis dalmanni TaxID=139649 RepID=UPI0018CF6B3A|nr:uncharacterized protein LOC119682684 [Teleopsis dalmanni]
MDNYDEVLDESNSQKPISINPNGTETTEQKLDFKYPIGWSKIFNQEIAVDTVPEYSQLKKDENKVGSTSKESQPSLHSKFEQSPQGSTEYRKATQYFLNDGVNYFKNKPKVNENINPPRVSSMSTPVNYSEENYGKCNSPINVLGHSNINFDYFQKSFNEKIQKASAADGENNSVPYYLRASNAQYSPTYKTSNLNATAKEFFPSIPIGFRPIKPNEQHTCPEDSPPECNY